MGSAIATTDLLERALVAARDLPAEMQGEVTRLVLAYVGDDPPAIPPFGDDLRRPRQAGAPTPGPR